MIVKELVGRKNIRFRLLHGRVVWKAASQPKGASDTLVYVSRSTNSKIGRVIQGKFVSADTPVSDLKEVVDATE